MTNGGWRFFALIACAFALGANSIEVRVRVRPAGPQLQVDGVSVPPRFFWGRSGAQPLDLTREWRRFELPFTPSHDIRRASLHFRFDETNGTTQIRDLRLCGTSAPALPPLERFNVWPKNSEFRPTVEEGVFTLVLHPYEGKAKDPDYHLYSPNLAFKRGDTYTLSFEARGDGCEWLEPKLYEIADSGAHTPVFMGKSESDALLVTTRLAADAGVNLVSFHAPSCWGEAADDYGELDDTFDRLIAVNPKVLLVPRVILDAPDWWLAAHPDSRIRYADGTRASCASVADLEYRREAGEYLSRLCKHLMSRYPRHFAGVHFGAQETGENMYYKSWARKIAGNSDDLQNAMADFIAEMAHVARQATESRKLVVAFYGYAYECCINPFGPGNSGHYALQRLLDRAKNDIDILCSPVSYYKRSTVGAVAPMAGAETVMRSGVLWLCEDDTRTFLDRRRSARVTEGPKYDLAGTQALLKHNLEVMTEKGYGSWWMDLPGRGWYASKELWEVMKAHLSAERAALKRPSPFAPEVASIIDEASLVMLTNQPILVTGHLVKESRDIFAQAGCKWGQYLLSDVARGGVKAPFKFFQAAWKLDDEQLRGLLADRKANPAETRVWFYAPGRYDGAGREDLSRMTKLTGFVFRPCPAAAKQRGIFTVEKQPGDLVWQAYADGSPAVIARKVGDGYDVFISYPIVPLSLVRRILKELRPQPPEIEPENSNLTELLAAPEFDFPVGGEELRVRSTAGGPRLFRNGEMVRPRFCYAGFGTGPTPVTNHWTKTELSFTLPRELPNCHIHIRFPQPQVTGEVALRNFAIIRKDGAPFDSCLEGGFSSTQAFAKAWGISPRVAPFPWRLEDGAWITTLAPWTKPVRPPDYILVSKYMTLKANVEYVLSYETRSEVVDCVQPSLYHVTADRMHYINLPIGGEPPAVATVKKAAEVGVDAVLFCPILLRYPEGEDWRMTDSYCDMLIAANPKVQLIPRVSIDAPTWWLAEHPTLRMKDEQGNWVRMSSVASQAYRNDTLAFVARFIKHMAGKYPNNFGGIQPVGQSTSEWFYQESQRKLTGYDPATLKAYRKWRKARGLADWECAEVPSPEHRRARADDTIYLDPVAQADVVEFNRFLQDNLADFLGEVFELCRKLTKGCKLVFSFYGYSYTFTCNGPGPAQTGHYALQQMLDRHAKNFDFLCAPISYVNRGWTGTSLNMSAPETIERHGVMWFDENDARTYLAKPSMADSGPGLCLQTKQKTLDVLRRDTTRAILRNTGAWWMDLNGRGWWNDADLWKVITETEAMERQVMVRNTPYAPEIAFVLDEETCLNVGAGTVKETGMLGRVLQMVALCGVPYGQYLLSDVLRNGLDAKFQIFHMTRENEAQLKAKLAAAPPRGVTRLWIRMPGDPGFAVEPVITRRGSDTDIVCPLKRIVPSYDPVFLETYRPTLLYSYLAQSGVHMFFDAEMCGKATVWASHGFATVQALDDVAFTLRLPDGKSKPVSLRKGQCKVFRLAGSR